MCSIFTSKRIEVKKGVWIGETENALQFVDINVLIIKRF